MQTVAAVGAGPYSAPRATMGARVNPAEWVGAMFVSSETGADVADVLFRGAPGAVGAMDPLAFVREWSGMGRETADQFAAFGRDESAVAGGAPDGVAGAIAGAVVAPVVDAVKGGAVRVVLALLALVVIALGLYALVK